MSNQTLVIGAGIAGIVTALELLERGQAVLMLDRGDESSLGGQAMQAFGGMALVDTPLQRRAGIRDSAQIALNDWLSFAQFGPEDLWPRRWAEHYVDRCVPDVYEWLRGHGLRFIPSVQWVERGWMRPGNSLPRYHVLWGTSQRMTRTLLAALRPYLSNGLLQWRLRHRVTSLTHKGSAITGCAGIDEARETPFEIEAAQVVVASGGVTGDLDRVRQHWPRAWGAPPTELLNGSHPSADGAMHDEISRLGGQVTHLDQMWNYAAGVKHPTPQFEGHGLSLIPTKSSLWLDPDGQRIGPVPFVTGFDTREMVAHISRHQWTHTWQVLNRRIALKELAASGAEHNPLIRDQRKLALAWQMLRGNPQLVDDLLTQCEDFIQAPTLPELVRKMNALVGDQRLSASVLDAQIQPYDAQIARGPRFHNDDQLRRIAQLRLWTGDRMRTCKAQRILDADAGPLIAIRCRLLTRKSTGGIQTDLDSRVLDAQGRPMTGLYAVGEASGFGGGGSNGKGSLEGTFLSGCILTSKAAARHIGAGVAPRRVSA